MFTMGRALCELSRLSGRERRAFGQAALLLPWVHLLQQTLPFRRWRPLLTRARPGRPSRAGAPSPNEIARAVERARRAVPGEYKCLPAAYAAHLLLHRHGYESRIEVGVARDRAGQIEAHAWVECGGRILIGELPDLGRFVPLPRLEL